MIWVGSMFYPGTGNDWNLPREVQNPPAYAMQNDKAQFILESTGLEGYRGYGRQPMPRGNMAAFGGSSKLTGLRGNIPLRGYGAADIQSAMGMPARLRCSRTPSGMINCKPRYSFSWDEYANRVQL